MMERYIVAQRVKEFQIQEFMEKNLSNVGHSHTILKKIPLGEKIIIHASRPGLIVGRKGLNIKELTAKLKREFKLENPQIEISEVKNTYLNAEIVAEKITQSLERFGSQRFKGIGHKTLERVMDAGALGVEILISGKLPGSRARTWRFYQGYLKKCGDTAVSGVLKAYRDAKLKTGIIGVQVRLMPPDIHLPDKIVIRDAPLVQEDIEDKKVKKKKTKKKSKTRKAKVEPSSDQKSTKVEQAATKPEATAKAQDPKPAEQQPAKTEASNSTQEPKTQETSKEALESPSQEPKTEEVTTDTPQVTQAPQEDASANEEAKTS